MRLLRIVTTKHLYGPDTRSLVVPCGTRRTKRRTLKKWLRRAARFEYAEHARMLAKFGLGVSPDRFSIDDLRAGRLGALS